MKKIGTQVKYLIMVQDDRYEGWFRRIGDSEVGSLKEARAKRDKLLKSHPDETTKVGIFRRETRIDMVQEIEIRDKA
jgi:hypothetical protein